MGVKDMPKTLKDAGDRQRNISDFAGSTLGVDVEGWLHKAASTTDAAVLCSQLPPVPIPTGVAVVGALHRRLVDLDITPVYVFGGSKHAGKADEDDWRAEQVATAQSALASWLLTAVPTGEAASKAYHTELNRLKKAASYCREDFITLVIQDLERKGAVVLVAPYEAEWQLVSLETDGLTDGTLTSDSDLFPLGSTTMIFDLDSAGNCIVVKREDARQCADLGGGRWDDETIARYSALCGCDYVQRVSGQGKVKAKAIVEACLKSKEACAAEMLKIERTQVYGIRGSGASCVGYSKLVDRAISIFRYPPVFKYVDEDADRESFDDVDAEVILTPLNPLPPGTTHDDWIKMLGFDPADVSRDDIKPALFFRAKVWSRTMEPFRALDHPTQGGVLVPHGSTIDFAQQPIDTHPMQRLALWLWTRNVPPRSNSTWGEIIASVKSIVAMGSSGPGIQPLASAVGGGHYLSLEPLITSSTLVWVTDKDVLLESIRGLENATMKRIGDLIGPRNHNGVRKRAYMRFLSGSCLLDTLKMTTLVQRSTNETVVCFDMMVSPSMKQKDYRLAMIFKAGVFQGSPFSRCGCPDGNLFCSHMLSFWIIIYLFQQFGTFSFSDFQAALPEPVKSVHSVPIPWSYLFKYDSDGVCQLSAGAADLQEELDGGGAAEYVSEGESSGSESDDEGVDILSRAHEYMEKSIARAKNEASEAKGERPVKRANITAYSKQMRLSRSGDLSFAEQRQKDEVHERMHLSYEKGELEKTTLAFYLREFTEERRARLAMPTPAPMVGFDW
jgi:exonuclease-1